MSRCVLWARKNFKSGSGPLLQVMQHIVSTQSILMNNFLINEFVSFYFNICDNSFLFISLSFHDVIQMFDSFY